MTSSAHVADPRPYDGLKPCPLELVPRKAVAGPNTCLGEYRLPASSLLRVLPGPIASAHRMSAMKIPRRTPPGFSRQESRDLWVQFKGHCSGRRKCFRYQLVADYVMPVEMDTAHSCSLFFQTIAHFRTGICRFQISNAVLRKILAYFRIASAAAAGCAVPEEFLGSPGAIYLPYVHISLGINSHHVRPVKFARLAASSSKTA